MNLTTREIVFTESLLFTFLDCLENSKDTKIFIYKMIAIQQASENQAMETECNA